MVGYRNAPETYIHPMLGTHASAWVCYCHEPTHHKWWGTGMYPIVQFSGQKQFPGELNHIYHINHTGSKPASERNYFEFLHVENYFIHPYIGINPVRIISCFPERN